jgi:molecular chaperone DnaK (HSP70)
MPAIGIDLGITSARVAVWKDGVIHVIPNEHGKGSTPCYVAFTNDERQIGQEAQNQVSLIILYTTYLPKR